MKMIITGMTVIDSSSKYLNVIILISKSGIVKIKSVKVHHKMGIRTFVVPGGRAPLSSSHQYLVSILQRLTN